MIRVGADVVHVSLFDRALGAVSSGRLPRTATICDWGRLGSGELCTLCERPIGQSEGILQFEMPGQLTRKPLHFGCYYLWEEACAHLDPLPS